MKIYTGVNHYSPSQKSNCQYLWPLTRDYNIAGYLHNEGLHSSVETFSFARIIKRSTLAILANFYVFKVLPIPFIDLPTCHWGLITPFSIGFGPIMGNRSREPNRMNGNAAAPPRRCAVRLAGTRVVTWWWQWNAGANIPDIISALIGSAISDSSDFWRLCWSLDWIAGVFLLPGRRSGCRRHHTSAHAVSAACRLPQRTQLWWERLGNRLTSSSASCIWGGWQRCA